MPASTTVTTPATAAAAFGLGTCFVHHKIAPSKILAVQGIDGAVCFFVIGNFNEGKAAGLTRETVANQINCGGIYTGLREVFVQAIFRRGKRKITNIELLHLPTPSARNPLTSRGAR
jgi:hypothetical protein